MKGKLTSERASEKKKKKEAEKNNFWRPKSHEKLKQNFREKLA